MATNEHGGETDEASDGRKSDHTKRKYMVGRVALRTKFFDTRLLEAVSSGPPAAVRQVQNNLTCIFMSVTHGREYAVQGPGRLLSTFC